MIKSITARQIFDKCPKVKQKLWGGEFQTDGYFASSVGKHGNEDMIGKCNDPQKSDQNKRDILDKKIYKKRN